MPRLSIRTLRQKKRRAAPGTSPGTLAIAETAKKPVIKIISYSADRHTARDLSILDELPPLLNDTNAVTWIDVRGVGDESVMRELARIFGIHPLALEDVVHGPQRPKTETYDNHQFVIARMVMLRSSADMEAGQLSIFLGRNYVLTFQENLPDCLNPVRERLARPGGMHRKMGADYLCYSILDAVVDQYFPVLEAYGEYLEELEDQTVATPTPKTLRHVHIAKRELLDLRRVLWPQRDTLNQLIRDESPYISAPVRVFLRDCYDHAVQVMDMVETYREITSGLHDVYLSSIANRTNDIMKVLTIISTIFIPLTFVAGIYGMNFDYMPELKLHYGYPMALLLMMLIGLFLMYYFWQKGWVFSGGEKSRDKPGEGPP